MLSSRAFIASLFLVTMALAADINDDFHHILNGLSPLEHEHVE